MYAVSAGFKTAIKQSSRVLGAKIIIGTDTIYDDNIQDMNISDSVCGESNFSIGNMCAKTLKLNLINYTGTIDGKTITPYIGLLVAGALEFVPMGLFYIENVVKLKGITTITAYDKMAHLEGEYASALSYPANISAIMSELCTMAGITFSGSFNPDYSIPAKVQGYSYRNFIGFIASVYGGNARFDRIGNLIIQKYAMQPLAYEITGDKYFDEFDKNEANYVVSKVACKFGDVAIASGASTANTVAFSNPMVTQTILDNILTLLNGLTFRPGSLEAQGDPSLDAGDFIKILDTDDVTYYNVIVSQIEFDYNGGLDEKLISVGETNTQNIYEAKKIETKKDITEMNIKLGEISTTVSETKSITDANTTGLNGLTDRVATAESTAKQTAEEITSTMTKTYQTKSDAKNDVDTLNTTISEVKRTADDANLSFKSIVDNGVTKVITETGFKFDATGMDIRKTGEEFNVFTGFDTELGAGFFIRRNEDEVFSATAQGVETENLKVNKYLIVGANSRFEDYGTGRTGCFYIGS
jgi:hypothetical protein